MRGVVHAQTNLNHEGHEAHEEPVELDAIDSAAFVLSVIFVVNLSAPLPLEKTFVFYTDARRCSCTDEFEPRRRAETICH